MLRIFLYILGYSTGDCLLRTRTLQRLQVMPLKMCIWFRVSCACRAEARDCHLEEDSSPHESGVTGGAWSEGYAFTESRRSSDATEAAT